MHPFWEKHVCSIFLPFYQTPTPISLTFALKKLLMVYEFTYSSVLSRCKMLASFEGRDYTGDSGESLFLRVKLTEQDEPLLLSYLEEAARRIEERVARMVSASEYTEEGFTWTLRTEETRRNVNRELDRNISEALAAYTMMQWLADRKPARVEMYRSLWEGSSAMAEANLYRKNPPTLKTA